MPCCGVICNFSWWYIEWQDQNFWQNLEILNFDQMRASQGDQWSAIRDFPLNQQPRADLPVPRILLVTKIFVQHLNIYIYQMLPPNGDCLAKLVNEPPIHARHAQEGTLRTNILCCTRIFRMNIVWFQLTHFHVYWGHLWYVYTNVSPFCAMIIKMSEYFLMGKYLLVRWRTLILYNIIDGR